MAFGIKSTLTLDTTDFSKKLSTASRQAQKESDKIKRMFRGISAQFGNFAKSLATVTAPLALGLGLQTKNLVETASTLSDLSLELGVGADKLSEYSASAALVGVDIETLSLAWEKMRVKIQNATEGTGGEVFAKLGLNPAKLKQLNVLEQFEAIADGIGKIKNSTDQAGAVADVFGGKQLRLLRLLKDGAAGLRASKDEARALGLTLSTSVIDSADRLGDNFDKLKQSQRGLFASFSPELLDKLNSLSEKILEISKRVSDIGKNNPNLQKVFAFGAEAVGTIALISGISFGLKFLFNLIGGKGSLFGGLIKGALSFFRTLQAANRLGALNGLLALLFKLKGGIVSIVLGALKFTKVFSVIGIIAAGVLASIALIVDTVETLGGATDTTFNSWFRQSETIRNLQDGIFVALVSIGTWLENAGKNSVDIFFTSFKLGLEGIKEGLAWLLAGMAKLGSAIISTPGLQKFTRNLTDAAFSASSQRQATFEGLQDRIKGRGVERQRSIEASQGSDTAEAFAQKRADEQIKIARQQLEEQKKSNTLLGKNTAGAPKTAQVGIF